MSWTFPYLGETEELNETTRAEAPGDFVRLSNGYTHYELGGPKNGQPVVLVHGFSVPYFIWEPTFKFLTESGFRVLRYDLFGRGFSDRPKVRYDIDLFCSQLIELLDALGFEQINLVGLSMGGPITSTFTTHYPDRVSKLVLVDPAGAKPVTLSRLLKAVTTPGFGELALGLFGRKHMLDGIASDFYDPENIKAFADKYMVQLKYKGFMRAILSTMRSGMLDSFAEVYQQLGTQGTPVALFWGKNDKTVPFEHHVDICTAIPQAKFYAIDECGHIPHYERPNEFNPILLKFLN
jgi:pimeloyl-ACP methyl ester carboxylesterase